MENITNKKVLVIGMGKSGIAAAEALLAAGVSVTVYDKKNREDLPSGLAASLEQKGAEPCFGHDPEHPEMFDQVIMSPGVPVELPFVQAAKAAGAEIIGELELAYRMGRGSYAAITGTNGKTTTTVLTGEIFKAAGRLTEVVGNVGVAVITKALEASEDTWLVTECSSFQLDTTTDFRPHVSALLNLTPDHLDRHKTFENYADAKGKIFANQTEEDFFIVNADDAPSMEQAKKCKAVVVPFSRKQELDFGCFVKDGKLVIRPVQGDPSVLVEICAADE
ncbi:MAG: UDP-N-acetylmuramoyl-L-alanine--D-glutamate ligase, partial [Firmicutes bacterium]|nr:UDP-N-acetylmuramoyl-L-alanine--D-glutamate ligase [Bacillota bacterium]